jgi:2-amino-4-hydroxy-6-hydroxymethyldihydropteridine diphosphokinase
MPLVFIGLGSNLGDRQSSITKAHDELFSSKDYRFVRASSIEETAPVDYLDQPYFLNQIILIETETDPARLLKVLKGIEKKMGRKKTISKGPRNIDMDILLYDDIILRTHALTIPHPEIKNRKFVLKHLIELDPSLREPGTGILYREIYEKQI